MSRLKGAAEKLPVENLTPYQEYYAYCDGQEYTKDIWASQFAQTIYALRKRLASHSGPLRVFLKPPKAKPAIETASIEQDAQEVMREALSLLLDCSHTGNVAHLRNLADAIEAGKKPLKPAVDQYRAWLWMFLNMGRPDRPLRVDKTFSEIRAAFFQEFGEGMESAQLREMIKKMRVICKPGKPGPEPSINAK
jgi:hypothetical protein